MAHDNDPNRMIDPDRPGPDRPGFNYSRDGSLGWVPMILAVAAVALLIMLLLPSRNDTGPRVTENAPRIEKPTAPTTTPPANKPAPTAPAPTPPQ